MEQDEFIAAQEKQLATEYDMIEWSKTPAGLETVDALEKNVYRAVNHLFALAQTDPDVNKLLSTIHNLHAMSGMLDRFT